MTDAANGSSGSSVVLDELVPSVHPLRHRIVIAAAIVLAAAAAWAAVAGWVVPLTDGPELRQWGGTSLVSAVVHVGNDSPRQIEVTGLGADLDGLSVLGYTTAPPEQRSQSTPTNHDVFPLRLDPGEQADIAVVYQVDDCAAAQRYGSPPSVEIRFPGLTGMWSHTRETSWSDSSRTWPAALTQFACPR